MNIPIAYNTAVLENIYTNMSNSSIPNNSLHFFLMSFDYRLIRFFRLSLFLICDQHSARLLAREHGAACAGERQRRYVLLPVFRSERIAPPQFLSCRCPQSRQQSVPPFSLAGTCIHDNIPPRSRILFTKRNTDNAAHFRQFLCRTLNNRIVPPAQHRRHTPHKQRRVQQPPRRNRRICMFPPAPVEPTPYP